MHCGARAAVSSMRRRGVARGRGRCLGTLAGSRGRKSGVRRQGWSGVELRPTLVALLLLVDRLGASAGTAQTSAPLPDEPRSGGASRTLPVQWGRVGTQDFLPLHKSKSPALNDYGALQEQPLSRQQRQQQKQKPQLATVQHHVPSHVSPRQRIRAGSSEYSSAGGHSSAAIAHQSPEAALPGPQGGLQARRRREEMSDRRRLRYGVAFWLSRRAGKVQMATGSLRQKGKGMLAGDGQVGGQRLDTTTTRRRERPGKAHVPASTRASEDRQETGLLKDSEDVSASVASAAILGPTRSHKFDLTDFGAKGDGTSDNTRAFQNAMYALSSVADKGGGQLFIPPGRYLTGCFNLTSSMTLFLAKGAVLMANPDVALWPILPPLQSYGRGREMPGPRFSSFIYGQNLTDVIITGDGGVVDGMGSVWWQRAKSKQLNYSRGPLIQFLWSTDVIVANITLLNSSYWALHPVYSRNVTLGHLKIIAPDDSPNTGGIFPDSCKGVLIEGVDIRTGADCVGIKSGWDEYGIRYNQSSSGVVVRGCHLRCVRCSALSIGSEMSGGVSDVLYEDVVILESQAGFRLKTAPGRGGYVQGIALRNIVMEKVGVAISFLPLYGQHADDRYDPTALPLVSNFTFENVSGCEISQAGILEGLPTAPFRQIHITHVHLDLVEGGQGFSCRDVNGTAKDVIPTICKELQPSIRIRDDAIGSTHVE